MASFKAGRRSAQGSSRQCCKPCVYVCDTCSETVPAQGPWVSIPPHRRLYRPAPAYRSAAPVYELVFCYSHHISSWLEQGVSKRNRTNSCVLLTTRHALNAAPAVGGPKRRGARRRLYQSPPGISKRLANSCTSLSSCCTSARPAPSAARYCWNSLSLPGAGVWALQSCRADRQAGDTSNRQRGQRRQQGEQGLQPEKPLPRAHKCTRHAGGAGRLPARSGCRGAGSLRPAQSRPPGSRGW